LGYKAPMIVSAFYRFLPLPQEEIQKIRQELEAFGQDRDLTGLVLLGSEGINGTVSGPTAVVQTFQEMVRHWVKDPAQVFKDSLCEFHPFHELKVKIKPEIVTLKRPELVPPEGPNRHLSPKEWHETMDQEDVIVLDTRNDYETRIGKFKNAREMDITDFHDFPVKVREMNLPKDKKILMYCTGGIRCEKAILEMNEQGYENVYQLEGGILNYLKEFPRQKFEGECFVFDYRVAVDQELGASNSYRLCPHCGEPSNHVISCVKCGTEAHVCEKCLEKGPDKETCSKNCAHHFRIASRSKRPQKEGFRKQPKPSNS